MGGGRGGGDDCSVIGEMGKKFQSNLFWEYYQEEP